MKQLFILSVVLIWNSHSMRAQEPTTRDEAIRPAANKKATKPD